VESAERDDYKLDEYTNILVKLRSSFNSVKYLENNGQVLETILVMFVTDTVYFKLSYALRQMSKILRVVCCCCSNNLDS